MIPISQGGNPSSSAAESADWELFPFVAVGGGNDVGGVTVAVVVVVKFKVVTPELAATLVGSGVGGLWVGMSRLARLVGGDDDVPLSLSRQ